MSEDEFTRIAIIRVISDLPAEDQEKVNECAAKLRTLIDEYGRQGRLALALVGSAEAASAE